MAAAKICEIEHEEDLEDFAVEIDILSECKHENIVQLLEAYTFENKLWVSVLMSAVCMNVRLVLEIRLCSVLVFVPDDAFA